MCVRNSASVSTTIQLEFRTFATAWYFFLWFFILYYLLAQENPTMFVMGLMSQMDNAALQRNHNKCGWFVP